ncbi:MAG: DUF11 domain-containing protein, partial [Anaerolineae bacterium]|nr:DUF11 domain-containing protein [Anaerolineae bacterium]
LLTYTVTFTNAGLEAAFSVVLTDIIPALLVDPLVVYASPEVLTPTAGVTFAWTISGLLPGDSGAVQIRARVDPAAQPGSVVVNQAELAATILDPAPWNNVVSVTTTIRAPDAIHIYLPLVLKNHP